MIVFFMFGDGADWLGIRVVLVVDNVLGEMHGGQGGGGDWR